MRTAVIGGSFVASLLLIMAVVGMLPSVGFAQRPAPATTGGELITLTAQSDNRQQVTVIDTSKRVMSVYQIDMNDGKITLRSVRNLFWDLQMSEFNGTSPLPREIRALLEQK